MKIWKTAEDKVKKQLESEFKQQFSPKRILVGSQSRQFDLVSDKGTIVAQVKSCSQKLEDHTPARKKTRFQRDYIFDCLLLTRVQAEKRFFFLVADPKLFEDFVNWSEGLVPGVEMRCIDISSF